ncbi:hypothetical protein B0H13DRAFT_2313564 [Mycena leptocephala]|nr:hypothetical protein B0H13DRAFT_2313564 [Mycena leptocephala]
MMMKSFSPLVFLVQLALTSITLVAAAPLDPAPAVRSDEGRDILGERTNVPFEWENGAPVEREVSGELDVQRYENVKLMYLPDVGAHEATSGVSRTDIPFGWSPIEDRTVPASLIDWSKFRARDIAQPA